jgi:Holliday junction DNA helicase RuvB
MTDEPGITTPVLTPDDQAETSLRPQSLIEFVGQDKIKKNLEVYVAAAKKRAEHLDHVLFEGPPGLGKTTLAYIVSRELGVTIKSTSAPAIERTGDLAAVLTNLARNDCLFIDEIHRLPPAVEEVLYQAMEDFQLDIMIGQGPSARSVKIPLQPFTLIGATTRSGLLTSPLLARFGINLHLDFYAPKELEIIIARSAKLLDIGIDAPSCAEIACRSRGTPRIANRLLKRVRDFAQVEGSGTIDLPITRTALERLEVDAKGLDEKDRKFLSLIMEKFDGGPVGIDTISVALGEDRGTIEDVYEPFLIQSGFVKRTSRGRVATGRAYEHLGLKPKSVQDGLFD